MSGQSESSGTKSVPIFIQSESAFNIGIHLTETNYDVWSQLMEMHIAEREKLSYIRGKEKSPKETDEGYEKWYAENQRVKRWILMSMNPEIMKRYIRLPTAHEIWSALKKAFYDESDELQVFALHKKAFTAKQSGRALSVYYGELTEIFQELDHRDKVVMNDAADIAAYKKSIDRQRVHIFLAGLDDVFSQICGEILRKESIQNLEDCYFLVRREDIRRTTLNKEVDYLESSALMAQKRSKPDKSNYKCSHCRKIGHTKGRCFELVGYPEWWDHNRGSQTSKGNSVNAIVEMKTKDESALVSSTTEDDFLWQ